MTSRTILIISLVGNLALAAATYHFLQPSLPGRATFSSAEKTAPGKTVSNGATISTQTVTNLVADDFSWKKVESEDYKEYIVNLRAIGCPEATIRDMIVADVNKMFAGKSREIRGDTGEYKYWKSEPNSWNSKEGYDRQKQMREMEKQKTTLLVELLGSDPNKDRSKELGYLDYWERQYSFLSDNKKAQARTVREKYDEQRQELYRNGIVDDEDQKALRKVETAQKAELAQFLTPVELEQYELRASQMANQLRYDLDAFEPSEEEFKQVFRIRKAREDDLAYAYDPDDKAAQERRTQAVKETDEQIKTALGAQRFDDYKMGQDYAFRELARMADRLELPKGTAKGVYDMKKVAEDQVKKVRDDKTLTNEQRDVALQSIRTATENAIVSSLGSKKNFDRYKSRGGHWISNLAPTPRPPTAVVDKP